MKKSIYRKDKDILVGIFQKMPTKWDGRKSILKLKERNYQWKQMEWIGWFFEILCRDLLKETHFIFPGKKYGNVKFDALGAINWDIKTSAIKSDSHRVILNDKMAMNESIKEFGYHGVILCLVDVEYNDDDRSFQKWHSELKGGLSRYEVDRIKRNATSRYRKTFAEVKQIFLLVINKDNRIYLDVHKQGRNSDGKPRNPKYMLNIEKLSYFEISKIDF